MAPNRTVVFIGQEAVVRRMSALADAVASHNLEIAGRAMGLPVEEAWKRGFRKKSDPSIAGVAPRRQTGTYSRSIHTEIESVSRNRVLVKVGTSITQPPYPAYLEYGTSKMPAHPIARPAWDASKHEAQRAGERVLKRLLGL